MTLTYRKYRGGFGAEFASNEHVWHGSNLREVKAHAREHGATRIEIRDSYASIQRPKHIVIELEDN